MAFTIVNEWTKTNKKFRLTQYTVEFKLNSVPSEVSDPEHWLKDGLKDIYDGATKNLTSEDKVGLTLSSDLLQFDVHNPITDMCNVTFERLWDMLHNLYQSNTEGSEGDTLKLTVTRFPNSKATEVHGSGISQSEIQGSVNQSSSEVQDSGVVDQPILEVENTQLQEDVSKTTVECTECQCKYSPTDLDLCDKCYIKGGHCTKRFIPYSTHSWASYEEFKQWQRAYDRKMVKCDICGKEMIRTSIYRHKTRWH